MYLRTFLITFAVALIMPLSLSAHASPISAMPESSSTVAEMPAEVVIRFSERLEEGASRMSVRGPNGAVVSGTAYIRADDRHMLVASTEYDGDGVYLISWSVVSSDDGHFTRGSQAFAVGSGDASAASYSQMEIVLIASGPEALTMTVELLGNGILWATLLLFALVIRPILRRGEFAEARIGVERGYTFLVTFGAVLAIVGGIAHMLLKVRELAALHEETFTAMLPVYAATSAGSAGLWRIGAVFLFASVFFFARTSIFRAERVSPFEFILAGALILFAYLRGVVSHATANPFLPEVSVLVNMLHLVPKDAWAGVLMVLVLLTLSRSSHRLLFAVLPGAFALLAVFLVELAMTGAYITWLHVKSLGNLFATEWGNNFIVLGISACVMVMLRVYHTFSRIAKPDLFGRVLPATLSAELVAACLVLYFSSVVIITSPPIAPDRMVIASTESNGIGITLEHSLDDDSNALVVLSDGSPAASPTLYMTSGQERLLISGEERFPGGYAIPKAILAGASELDITVPQTGAYDGRATFTLESDALQAWDPAIRTFDVFAVTVMLCAAFAAALAVLLYVYARKESELVLPGRGGLFLGVSTGVGLLALAMIVLPAVQSTAWTNPFRALCEADVNMWHTMQPTREGQISASIPREGCMGLMGEYHFSDEREYRANRDPSEAIVVIETPEQIQAGVPVELTIRITNQDGTPARLFLSHEKLVHVIVVSRDQRFFAHVHPDDVRPLSAEEIASAEFTLPFTFPTAGEYIVAVDYANRLRLGSFSRRVPVGGVPEQESRMMTYASPGNFGGYDVSFRAVAPIAGEVTTVYYIVEKDGEPVTDMEPYLGAAMHVAAVKDDLSGLVHTHGELHDPDVPPPPVIVRDGRILHTIEAMYLPPNFGPYVDSHLIFDSPGIYTIWGEMRIAGEVVSTAFTIRVEESFE